MNLPKCDEYDYIGFLMAVPEVFSCTEAGKVQPDRERMPSYDPTDRLLYRLSSDTEILWQESARFMDPKHGVLIPDDSASDKPYAEKIQMVTYHRSGRHHSVVRGIGLITLSRTDGVSREFELLFPDGKLTYLWRNQQRSYVFKALPKQKFSNSSLKIDGKKLFDTHSMDDLQRDAITLLLFGSAYSGDDSETTSALAKCEIGDYLGKPDTLATFIRQRYIWVSRITGGAQSNNLGQLAQKFVGQYIDDNLKLPAIEVLSNGRLPGVTHTDVTTGRLTSFDLVVTDRKKYVAVEVSFQVTTNSVIERKSGQSKARYEQIEGAGHKIAYVLDGSGNFERETALRTICAHSHCTVAFSRSELNILCEYLKKYFAGVTE